MNLHHQITDLGGVWCTKKVRFGENWRHQVVLRLPVMEAPGVYIEVIHYSEYGAVVDDALSTAFSRATKILDACLLTNIATVDLDDVSALSVVEKCRA